MEKMSLRLVWFCLCLWHLVGVLDIKGQMKLVTEGDSVTLNTGLTELMDDDRIQWKFGREMSLIAEINVKSRIFTLYDDVLNGKFRDRLKLDHHAGSLTIKNTTTEDSEVYELHTTCMKKRFFLTVYDETESLSVMEGDSVTLHTDDTEMNDKDLIIWVFATEITLVAPMNVIDDRFNLNDERAGRSFKGRLKVDHQTGSLTITHTRTTDSGVYELQINRNVSKNFSLTVYARLPVPVINRDSPQCSSSSSSSGTSVSSCSLLCAVVNVSHVTLSWYKGNSLLSSISVSDLSISLSLPLEVECLDDSYSCVVAYSFTNRTEHLNNTQLCPTCSDSGGCCDSTEAVIRLVVTAPVGVAAAAAVVVLVYDIRSRKAEQDRAYIPTSRT